ncbi:uncharacterized protein G2W53_006067 [Senna tora]|uniref:Uncharacterized protein n=1 Tax=Senna tora TaxID=362788 RepID=A0A835CEF7_9FABA|nr:uncharacterized protein G2W53_006067 [Senna tora]
MVERDANSVLVNDGSTADQGVDEDARSQWKCKELMTMQELFS